MKVKSAEAQQLAKDTARSLTILKRLMPAAPGYQPPVWAQAEIGPTILPVIFAGAWDERVEHDKRRIAQLAGRSYDDIVAGLANLLPIPDSPVRKVGSIWKIASPRDAWFSLAPFVSESDIERFVSVVMDVLGAIDPRYEIAPDKRAYASLDNQMPENSGYLRTGLAEGVVLLGVFGERAIYAPNAAHIGASIVRRLLADAPAERWWSLSDHLSELAEAAPQAFLDAVSKSLENPDKPILALFGEDGVDIFGRAYHADLLWSLETLAWSEDYLAQVTDILAALSELDPGGRWANRPVRSLRQIFLLWHPQTSASLENRLKVLEHLRQTRRQAAWRLILDLYPKSHDIAHDSPLPRWRDFSAGQAEPATRTTIFRGAEQLGGWLMEDVGTDAERWVALTERYADLAPPPRSKFQESAKDLRHANLSDEERLKIRSAFRRLIHHHRQYPDANWSFPKAELDELEHAYEGLAPKDVVADVVWLFERDRAPLLHPVGHDWKANLEATYEARRRAVRDILSSGGADGLARLIRMTRDTAGFAGKAYAEVEDREVVNKTLAKMLKANDAEERNFVHGVIVTLFEKEGDEWAEALIDRSIQEGWSAESTAKILLALLPVKAKFMRRACEIGGEVERLYWAGVSIFNIDGGPRALDWVVEQFIKYGRIYDAVELTDHNVDELPADLLVRVLDRAVGPQQASQRDPVSFQPYVERLFLKLDEADIDRNELARLESAYLNVLEHSERPPKTLHYLLSSKPEFFVEVLSAIYRAKKKEDDSKAEEEEVTENQAAIARHAYTLLSSWRKLPGTSAGGIDAARLENWVKEARSLAAKAGRADIGDEKIGEMLSAAPKDADGTWPCAPVRDVIEIAGSKHLETGFYIGVKNSRGVTSRSPLEGGKQER